MATLSKTQIDRLGNRLKKGSPSDEDMRLLDEYRESFRDACDTVIRDIRDKLKLEPTGRPAKTVPSIIQKLRRESIRLSQIQDIAGCRIVVADISKQDDVVTSICSLFPVITVVDRRSIPSHGYRAVHLMAKIQGKLVEIQVRTELQHFWAELSERCSDVYDSGLKYGVGNPQSLTFLKDTSESVARIENIEKDIPKLESKIVTMQTTEGVDPELPKQANVIKLQLIEVVDQIIRAKEMLLSVFADLIAGLEKQKGTK